MNKKLSLDVFLHSEDQKYHVGKCLQANHKIYFEYQPEFISRGLGLSPFKLPHMHSLSGLLHANFRISNLDYTDFLKATWLLTQDQLQVYQGFRRMIFKEFVE